ncbi:condensation domain-containing protein [Mesorhizobium sp.]|uniref:condensation domain-containing protein n=1 Tax=Mesorhizobium sp. TaxID=1871066 RepID=UPI002580D2FC|nr:condensation domain-containing protein [Mesorhizobium sp.]
MSVHLLLALLAQDEEEAVDARPSFADHARRVHPVPGSSEYRRDLAYWKEILHYAPAIVPIPGRSRAASPAGMGSNRGRVGLLEITLPAAAFAPKSELLAARFLTAYAKTLANRFSRRSLVVDRWYSERGEGTPNGLIGPLDGSYPVVLRAMDEPGYDLLRKVERADANGHAHRSMDTSSLELALEEDLRVRHISLRQFGFAFLDGSQVTALAALVHPLDAIAASAHEIQLSAAVSEAAVVCRLTVDLDVVEEATSRLLLDEFLGELSSQLETSGPLVPEAMLWRVREWSGQPSASVNVERSLLDGVPNVEREIAVTSTQLGLLRFQEHPDATAHARAAFLVSKEFKIRPQMDAERLRRAIETIMARHEVMRTRFFRKGAGYGAYLERTPTEFFRVEQVADEAEAMERATELAQERIDIEAPMFRVTVIRFGSECDLIVAKAHHLVVDGYSLGLIVEETVKAYLGLPLDPVEMSIDRFIRDFDHVGKPGSFERRDAFLRKVFAEPLPDIPNLGRKAKGRRTNVNLVDCSLGEGVTLSIPGDQQDMLRKRARAAGTTETAMIIAAFAHTIGVRGGVDDMVLQIPAALRHDRRLENYVNFVASDVPVRVRLSRYETLEALAVSIGEGIDEAIQFAPFMDSNYFGDVHDDVVAKGSYTSLFVVGTQTVERWTQATQSAPLQRANATGELDLGMFKVTPLPDMRREKPRTSELDLRTYPSGTGLGLFMTYDLLGYDDAEAHDILREVIERLVAGQSTVDAVEQAAV